MPRTSPGQLLIGACSKCPTASRWLLRLYSRMVGRVPSRLEWVAQSLRRKLCEKQNRLTVSLGHGQAVEIDLSSVVGQCIYFDGSYEPELTAFLERTLRQGMIVVDAGANIGELTVRMSRLVGSEGVVIAIEASPSTFESLLRNIELNRLQNVLAVSAALESEVGECTFYRGAESCSLASSKYRIADRNVEITTVRSTNLDTLLSERALPRVDLIKLDIEGAEIAALQGARRILELPQKPIIVVEYNHRVAANAGWSLLDLYELLDGHGYSIHVLGRYGRVGARLSREGCVNPTMSKVDLVARPSSCVSLTSDRKSSGDGRVEVRD